MQVRWYCDLSQIFDRYAKQKLERNAQKNYHRRNFTKKLYFSALHKTLPEIFKRPKNFFYITLMKFYKYNKN